MNNTPRNMTPTEIRCLMLEKNVYLSQIARELAVDPSSVWQIIEGKAASHRIRTKLAERLGIDVARIWPQTYLTGGPRKAGRPFIHGKKKAAA